jgi:hypothetical protein
MTQHIKPEPFLASVDVVERIVRLLKPSDEQAAKCRRDVADKIKVIAEQPAFVPQSIVKARFNDIAAKLQAAQKAVNKLPPPWRELMTGVSNRLTSAMQMEHRINRQLYMPKRSGSSPKVRTVARQKRLAADQAISLLTEYNGDGSSLTTMPNGKLYRVAALLCSCKSDMSRACAQALADVR